jgi:hypothetical protein
MITVIGESLFAQGFPRFVSEFILQFSENTLILIIQ